MLTAVAHAHVPATPEQAMLTLRNTWPLRRLAGLARERAAAGS